MYVPVIKIVRAATDSGRFVTDRKVAASSAAGSVIDSKEALPRRCRRRRRRSRSRFRARHYTPTSSAARIAHTGTPRRVPNSQSVAFSHAPNTVASGSFARRRSVLRGRYFSRCRSTRRVIVRSFSGTCIFTVTQHSIRNPFAGRKILHSPTPGNTKY